MNTVISWWRDSRGKVAVTLIVLWVGAFTYQFSFPSLFYPLVAVTLCVVFDILLVKVRIRADVFSLSSVVTGLLIGLILDPRGGAFPLVVACAASSLAKQLIGKGPHQHVFNPAVIGITISSLVAGGVISWWVAAWGYIPSSIIVIGMATPLRQLHRLWLPVLFLATYFLTFLFFVTPTAAIRLTLDGTVLLFAFVMIPEPMTSVLFGVWRYAWGILVGLLVFGESLIHISWVDPLLLALLVANAIGFFVVRPRVQPVAT